MLRYTGIIFLVWLLFSCTEKKEIISNSEKKEIIINKNLKSDLFNGEFGPPIDLSKPLWKGGYNNANVTRRLSDIRIYESQNTRDYKDSLEICYCYLQQDTLNIHIERATGFVFHGIQFQLLNNKLANARIRLSSDVGRDTIYAIEKVDLEFRDLQVKVGDTLFGKVKTEGRGGWQGYTYIETTEGFFKCIINKK